MKLDSLGLPPGVKLLPTDELADPNRGHLFIGGVVSTSAQELILYRGDLQHLTVPLSWFSSKGGVVADPTRFEVIDGGQTVRLGEFEAAADAILVDYGIMD